MTRDPFAEKPLVVVDVGARWGAGDQWQLLRPSVRILGFEPDREECERLNEQVRLSGDRSTSYAPVALGARRETRPFYVTPDPAGSSIFPPIRSVVEGITGQAVAEDGLVAAVEQITTVPLDEWCAENGVDYIDALKLDVQGGELEILRGAERMLATVDWVEVEVEFNPGYEGQPLFGDIDRFLRDRGFVLWRFGRIVHYGDYGPIHDGHRIPLTVFVQNEPHVVETQGGQVYWAEAYYVREAMAFTSRGAVDPERTARAATIAMAAGFPDFAFSADREAATAFAARLVERAATQFPR